MEMRPGPEKSAELLQRAQAGDDAALASLISTYLPRLRRWATGRMPRHAREGLDTEDVVQETVIAATKHLEKLEIRGEGALQAYLRRALSNRLTDLYRREGQYPSREDVNSQLPGLEPSPLEQVIGAEALTRYESALARLTERDRQAVVLRVEMCCGYEEIAIALKASGTGHARVTVSRALARLAREMRHGRH